MKYDEKNKGDMRLCSACGEWKKKREFGSQTVKMKNGRLWKGLRPDCKDCHNRDIRAYRRAKRNQRLLNENRV